MEDQDAGLPKDGVILRPYEDGDEEFIAELFEQCFGRPLSPTHWRWKYEQNPYGNHQNMVAVRDGRIVAHYGGYPVYMQDGLSRKVRSLHVGDIMTDPRVRGLGIGHRSVIARVTRAFWGRFCEGKVAFYFGAPSERHLRLGRMVLSYQEAGPVLLWSREGNQVPNSRWRDAFRRMTWWGCTIEEPETISPEVAELYDRVKGNLGISLCRDSAYLRWRYLLCPGKAYRFYRVVKRNLLLLWAVIAKEGDEIFLGDVLVERDNSTLFSLFVEELSRLWPGVALRIWAAPTVSWWTDMLTKAGFTSAPHPLHIHATLTIFDEENYSAARMRKEWFYAMGDFDLF